MHVLWQEPGRGDEYLGTLINSYLGRGGHARRLRAGEAYVDVGTLHGYREALRVLGRRPSPARPAFHAQPAARRRPRAAPPSGKPLPMIEAVKFWNEPNNKSHRAFEMDPEWRAYAP